MMKLAVCVAAAMLASSAAHAERPYLPNSFEGAPVEAMIDAYGQPAYQTLSRDGRDVVVFELVSSETRSSLARANGQAPSRRDLAFFRDVTAASGHLGAYTPFSRRPDTPELRRQAFLQSVNVEPEHAYALGSNDLDRARRHRPILIECQVGATLDESGRVSEVHVSDNACSTLNLR
ncbi:hypothetical protein [Oceanicaulis sp. MMSF_3324]|uniref:hypothetical protein n=1 Tax=Oceanicaulis sp. MMSF_3324 TaxID=3046702 RepID=UPI00273D7109|nr:hypothetical protein [Oceanicaulis sp. MMSF_3324]